MIGVEKHKLDLDTESFTKDCYEVESYISTLKTSEESYYTGGYNTPETTLKLHLYNVFLFPYENINILFRNINYYFRQKENNISPFYIRGWVNIYRKEQYLDWHGHAAGLKGSYHGFFCVNTNESVTDYRFLDGNFIRVNCENNLLVMGNAWDNLHRTYPSNKDRITIAFDIHPLKNVIKITETNLQFNVNKYWIPI